MVIDRIEICLIKIPLTQKFVTSSQIIENKEHCIVKLFSGGITGYGETALMGDPGYWYETATTAWYIQKEYIAPALLNKNIETIEDFENLLRHIRGHSFAKYGFEGALWHLMSIEKNKPVYKLLGGTRNTVYAGVGIGITENINQLLIQIEKYLNEGYRRIKIKIKPGWDVQVVAQIREKFGDIPLMVDANAAYSLDDSEIFQELDRYNLLMIEQPLHYEDLADHARLQEQLATPICLDESIANYSDAQAALRLKSCKIINIKPGRVGGLHHARRIHDLCMLHGVPVWCGGMLEFGVGRALNLALSTLPNFKFPGDISSSNRYFRKDIVSPPVEFTNGEITIPEIPGTGFVVDEKVLKHFTTASFTAKA